MAARDDRIRQLISEGLSDDEIISRLKEPEAGHVRSFVRGLPGYESAKKLTGWATGAAQNLPGIYDQYATGVGNLGMAIPEGMLRIAGMGERADKIGAAREAAVAEAGDPDAPGEGTARFAGTMLPYVAAGVSAGPSLLRGLAVDMAMDVPVAAASPDMSLAGMVAEHAEPGSMTDRVAETVSESPILRGVSEGAAGMGLGLAVAKGLPAAYEGLRGMGEAGHVIGGRADDVPPPKKDMDTGPVSDAIDTALTSDTPEAEAPARVPGEVETGMPGRWYSRLQRTIEAAPQSVATAEQWAGVIRNAKSGQSASEMEWTGIEDALSSRSGQRLTRDEVLGLARENEIGLTETVRGAGDDTALRAEHERLGYLQENARERISRQVGPQPTYTQEQIFSGEAAQAHSAWNSRFGRLVNADAEYQEAVRRRTEIASELARVGRGRPKFAGYTQGRYGERPESNYREMLVRLDGTPTGPHAKLAKDGNEWGVQDQNTGEWLMRGESYPVASMYVDRLDREAAGRSGQTFRTSHWDEPNVLAHLRLTDRNVGGQKTLFIEEMQSDWHKAGREQGYRLSSEQTAPMDAEYRRLVHQNAAAREAGGELPEADFVRARELEETLMRSDRSKIPDAPFKKPEEWTGLLFRRALQEAVEGGYDRLAWASGAQVADLYDLRKQIDSLGFTSWPAKGEGMGILQGFKDGEEIIKETIHESELANYVGKTPAQRLTEQPPDVSGRRMLQGEGLSVGGEWATALYDRIIPQVVRKEAKRLGLEIEPVSITGRSKAEIDAEMDRMHEEYDAESVDVDEDEWREAITRLQTERNASGAGGTNLSIRITPKARDLIKNEGQRLGALHPALLGPLVGAGAGATAGAASEEDPSAARILGGAALGAAGASFGMGLAGFRAASDDVVLTGLKDAPASPSITPSQQALDAAGEVKLPTFGLDPSGTERLQRHLARIIDTSRPSDLRRAPVSWEETKAIARDIGLDPSDLDKKAASRLTGAETLALRDLVAQNIDDMARLEKRLVTEMSDTGMPLTPGEIGETQRLINSLEAQNEQYLRKFLRSRSEAGRTLNNLKILANRTLDPAAWTAKAEKVKGSPLDEFQARQLRRLLASGDRLEVAKFVGGLYQAPMSEKLVTLWKAGLLSNPATHAGNMVGNFTMATLETLKDAPAALFDKMAAQVSDVRSKGGVDMDVIAAGWKAADFRGAARQVLTGDVSDASVLTKYDVQRQVSFDNWPASAFLNAYAGPKSRIFASLSAGDRIFKGFALGRSLMEQAKLVATSEGLEGAAHSARVDELINTDSALHARAIVDSEVATFLNKGSHTTFRGVDLAEAGEGLRKHLGPLGHVVAPFVRTPANIMDRVLEYSPVGLLADLPKMADWLQKIRQGTKNGGLTPQDLAELMELQREMVEQAGRATIGTSVILAGYVLAERGLLTGNYPSDAAERNVHELLNEQPHSIKVGEHWLSLDRVSPVGNLLTLGAEIHKMSEDPETGVAGAVTAAPAVLGKTVVEQSFLRGVQGGLEALSAPERSMANWVRTTVASAVPAVVYAAARATDPVIRDPQTVGEAVKARLPGMSQSIAPRISGFGEDRVRDTSLAGRVGQVASPFTMRESEADDPTKNEVARVTASIAPYRPRGAERGTPEYTELQREYGEETKEAVERAIASGEYRRMGREAERMIRTNSEYAGRSVEDVTNELMAEHIENAVRTARSRLTTSRR